MDKFFQHSVFNRDHSNQKQQLFYAIFFTVFTIAALGIDSVFFTRHFFNARLITNFFAIIYFSLFFLSSDSHLRKLMFVMVFLSYIGELIFCNLLGMYNYRTDAIPLYVPFGHAIVYGSGYVFANTKFAIKNETILRLFFVFFFIVLFLSVVIFLNDIFTLVFGGLFFLILMRKKWQNLYCFIALCVIFIELVGTYFQCWIWVPKIFGSIPAANPPMGAVFFYAGGDVLLAKIVSAWDKKSNNIFIAP
ncbi:hypothetical protein [Flavobacterium psychrotolerans]|uniref:Uncharacterized protein n=1 Tax=Flavobacterium psychrotolerans TaxID=2169410 RepID=A0A2U1JNZ3_9FLAO|nr:hypothetical protein [Flavobacterium psychrotolerans]PWA06900.1 hypothetical protein DB895_02660 [Flavobacterium psychrotolerans]